MIIEFLSHLKRVQWVWLSVERALRYARLRALMSCLISRFTHGLSERLIWTSFEGTYLMMMELSVLFCPLRHGDTFLCAKGWKLKVYSNSTRLHVNNHQSFFIYWNIFVFRNMTSFAIYDVAWQPLPVNLVLRYTSFI